MSFLRRPGPFLSIFFKGEAQPGHINSNLTYSTTCRSAVVISWLRLPPLPSPSVFVKILHIGASA